MNKDEDSTIQKKKEKASKTGKAQHTKKNEASEQASESLTNSARLSNHRFKISNEFAKKIEHRAEYQDNVQKLCKSFIGMSYDVDAMLESKKPPELPKSAVNPYKALSTALKGASIALSQNQANFSKMIVITKELEKAHDSYQTDRYIVAGLFLSLCNLIEKENKEVIRACESLNAMLDEMNKLRKVLATSEVEQEVVKLGTKYEDKLKEFDIVAGRVSEYCDNMYGRRKTIEGHVQQFLRNEEKYYKGMFKASNSISSLNNSPASGPQ